MWPFDRKRRHQFFGACHHCGGELGFRREVCSNRVPVVACTQCDSTFDVSYSPNWVFGDVQMQRRDCAQSPVKQLLCKSQISTKYVRERYWNVYELPNNVNVFYDSNLRRYDVQVGEEPPLPVGGVEELVGWLTDHAGA